MGTGDTAVLRREASGPTRLSDAIYDSIVTLIAQGDFALNSRMPSEAKLSEMFDASRPVVREALARLREDGVIVSRQGSGSYIRRQPDPAVLELAPVGSIADVQRCFEFRAGLAALRWEAEDIDKIDACMAELERCVHNGIIGTDEDNRLHEAIAEATHNSYHSSIQRQLRQHILAGMNITRSLSLRRTQKRVQLVQDEHVAVVEAIRKRDADAASEHMRTHILNARRRMFEGVGP